MLDQAEGRITGIKDEVEDILYSEKEKHKGIYKHPRILEHDQARD